jgi:hypothetical protein
MDLGDIEKSPVYRLSLGFFGALEELDLELSPQESGKFVGMLAELYNATGEIPSEAAIKIMLHMEYGSRSATAKPVTRGGAAALPLSSGG